MFRCICIIFRESYPSTLLKLKNHSGYKRYINIVNICICCATVGLDNKLYKMHGTDIKINCTRCTVQTSK